MRRILDDDDQDDEEFIEDAVLASAKKASAAAPSLDADPSDSHDDDGDKATCETQDDNNTSRSKEDVDSKGGCLGKGFNPYILSFDTLVKKIERRKSAWQTKPLDIDATIDRVMCPEIHLSGRDAMIIEEDGDDAHVDTPVEDPVAQSQNTARPVGTAATAHVDHGAVGCREKHDWQTGNGAITHGLNPITDSTPSISPDMASANDEPILHQQPTQSCINNDAVHTAGEGFRDAGGREFGVQLPPGPVADRSTKVATLVNLQHSHAAPLQDTLCAVGSASTTVREGMACGDRDIAYTSAEIELADQSDAQDGVHDSRKQSRRRQRYRLHEAKCNSPKADTTVSPPAEGMSQKDAGPDRRDVAEEDGEIDEDLQDLEDSDAASLQDFVDRNDEELMLEAAIAQERHAQQFLTVRRRRGNEFCDGEAEQSEDEAVSSDESDADDGNGDLSMEEIADMVRELRQKGLGEAEVARAHAQWLEDEDDKALKELMSGIKRGLKKGRNRVEEDEEEWDMDEARERRRAVMPVWENQAHIPQTQEQIISQYKRKLAALERTLESPVKPVFKAVDRREEESGDLARREHVALPDIADADDSPEAHPWAPLCKSQHHHNDGTPQTRPESQSRVAGTCFAGPSLMGKNKKSSQSVSIKTTSKSFMACTLGATASRAACGAGAATQVTPNTTEPDLQMSCQASFTMLREALGI